MTAERKSKYWQHKDPLQCPKGHGMIWLGSAFWICAECHVVFVQVAGHNKQEPAE